MSRARDANLRAKFERALRIHAIPYFRIRNWHVGISFASFEASFVECEVRVGKRVGGQGKNMFGVACFSVEALSMSSMSCNHQ